LSRPALQVIIKDAWTLFKLSLIALFKKVFLGIRAQQS
jgi:hypothetical protein